MIDCFVTSCATTKFRHGLAIATFERMLMDPDLNVEWVVPDQYCSPLEFRLKRRMFVEDLAKSPIYLICDDDVLPYHPRFVSEALRILKDYPEFKFACLRPKNIHIDLPEGNEELIETDMSAVGGCNFIYKGLIDSWPDSHSEADGWNTWEPNLLRSKGYKVGMFRNLYMNHVGVGFSTLWYNDNA